jgi:hypothetical protein
MPIQHEQPPNDVSPSFQMICGGPGCTCQASAMSAGVEQQLAIARRVSAHRPRAGSRRQSSLL